VKSTDPVDSWSAWILTVALNYTRSHFRRLRCEGSALRRLVGEIGSSAGDAAERVTRSVDLVRAISSLTRRQREVVTLYYRLDMPEAEEQLMFP
jgi:DNA-directed RNA polymerase specialized sigma24 family protein